ncbi:MAG TPA: SURF1 family protein [Woeseiaceae bacterium]
MRLGTLYVRDLLPPVAAIALVALFVSLGLWQLERAAEKRAVQAAFAGAGEYRTLTSDASYLPYQPLRATGRYLAERQFLVDNMILDGQLGYFVLTPFEYAIEEPLLLVNRGWLPKTARTEIAVAIEIDGDEAAEMTVKGRAGQLPRVGIRAGDAFAGGTDWPRIANWPNLDELSAALDRDVLPFVLLADPEPRSTLVRRWEPRQAGPMRHLGYAFQWFALAAAVVVTALVLYRKKRAER